MSAHLTEQLCSILFFDHQEENEDLLTGRYYVQLYDAAKNTAYVKEISDRPRKGNELSGINRPSRPYLCCKTERGSIWRERNEACTHSSQLNEYPKLPILKNIFSYFELINLLPTEH